MEGIDLFVLVMAGMTLGGLAAAIAREGSEREFCWWKHLALWAAAIALLCIIAHKIVEAEANRGVELDSISPGTTLPLAASPSRDSSYGPPSTQSATSWRGGSPPPDLHERQIPCREAWCPDD